MLIFYQQIFTSFSTAAKNLLHLNNVYRDCYILLERSDKRKTMSESVSDGTRRRVCGVTYTDSDSNRVMCQARVSCRNCNHCGRQCGCKGDKKPIPRKPGRTPIRGSGASKVRREDIGSVADELWSTSDLAFLRETVKDRERSICACPFAIGGELYVSDQGTTRIVRSVSELYVTPWYSVVNNYWHRDAEDARTVIKEVLELVEAGEIGLVRKGDRGSGILFDAPIPYHEGFIVPGGCEVMESDSNEWWDSTYEPTENKMGPFLVVKKLIVPFGTACRKESYKKVDKVHSLSALDVFWSRGAGGPWSSVSHIRLCVRGGSAPVYICRSDISRGCEFIALDHELMDFKEERGTRYHVVGRDTGAYLLKEEVEWLTRLTVSRVREVVPGVDRATMLPSHRLVRMVRNDIIEEAGSGPNPPIDLLAMCSKLRLHRDVVVSAMYGSGYTRVWKGTTLGDGLGVVQEWDSAELVTTPSMDKEDELYHTTCNGSDGIVVERKTRQPVAYVGGRMYLGENVSKGVRMAIEGMRGVAERCDAQERNPWKLLDMVVQATEGACNAMCGSITDTPKEAIHRIRHGPDDLAEHKGEGEEKMAQYGDKEYDNGGIALGARLAEFVMKYSAGEDLGSCRMSRVEECREMEVVPRLFRVPVMAWKDVVDGDDGISESLRTQNSADTLTLYGTGSESRYTGHPSGTTSEVSERSTIGDIVPPEEHVRASSPGRAGSSRDDDRCSPGGVNPFLDRRECWGTSVEKGTRVCATTVRKVTNLRLLKPEWRLITRDIPTA